MARRRRRLQLIENRRQRSATYGKRKEGLKLKASQLSSLCGVPIAVISFGPNGQLDTWPEDQGGLRDFLLNYRSLEPEKRRKHDLDLPTLLRAQAGSQNFLWDTRFDTMSTESLREIANSLESKMKAIDERIQQLLEENSKRSNQDNDNFSTDCDDQDNNNTSSGQGDDDSKCSSQGNNNTGSGRGDDSAINNVEGNDNTNSEQGLPPCSNIPVVFDPFPVNKRNAFPETEPFRGLDQSERFVFPPYNSVDFDPYLINYGVSMGVATDAWLLGSSSSSSVPANFNNHVINSSSQAFCSVPSSPLMPPPSTHNNPLMPPPSTHNNGAFDNDRPSLLPARE